MSAPPPVLSPPCGVAPLREGLALPAEPQQWCSACRDEELHKDVAALKKQVDDLTKEIENDPLSEP